ncbi:MAG: hypothetical protein INH41_04870 [Myxococcaceae bacterium]|nr:hypothetical protein [Myxococcaceae bacterium]
MATLLLIVLLGADDCARCHREQAAAHASSRHATAAREPVFTVSMENARSPWCLTCHQPERGAAGLTCRSCHGVKGQPGAVLGVHGRRLAGVAAHPIVVEPALSTSSCRGCHEFPSPSFDHLGRVTLSPRPMQATVSEMLAHDPSLTCAACHDVHAPRGAHDPATLRKGLRLSARAVDGGTELSVTAVGTAHRLPTGDSFRRLVLSVCDDPECRRPRGQEVLGPTFAYADGVNYPVFDKTLRDGETRVLRLPAARYWRAQFFFGNAAFEDTLRARDVLDDLGGGEVPGWVPVVDAGLPGR